MWSLCNPIYRWINIYDIIIVNICPELKVGQLMSSSNEKSPLVRGTDGSSITNSSIQRYTPFDGPEMKFRPSSSSASDASPEDEPGLPLPRAIFVVTNAALGAGMLNFPQAYSKTGGVGQALAVQAVSLFLIWKLHHPMVITIQPLPSLLVV